MTDLKHWPLTLLAGAALVAVGVPAWLALALGLAIALVLPSAERAATLKPWTTRSLQVGVVALGAGVNLGTVWRVGTEGALLTAFGLVTALLVARALGRLLDVNANTTLLLGAGTAICGGSAIAAVAAVIDAEAQDVSVALAVVFVLNAVGLLVFPPLGHALALSEPVFGRWAALAIHDTSSVAGAGLAYGATALEVATTMKLARALWIVPLTIAIALLRRRGDAKLGRVKWPWFILGFVACAALFSAVPAIAPAAPMIVTMGRRALVLALFLIGLGLSRDAITRAGVRPFALGVSLWAILAAASLPVARIVE